MSALGAILRPAAKCGVDDANTCVTAHPIFPEVAEIIWGGLAFLIIAGVLWKFALPAAKKAMADRTARIQADLDSAAADRASAAAEAAQIRQAKGDIAAERARILAEADATAATMLTDGRARLAEELADLEAKGMAEIATLQSRSGDELRAEISRLSTAAVDHVVSGSLDESTHQELIENFIARVGATS